MLESQQRAYVYAPVVEYGVLVLLKIVVRDVVFLAEIAHAAREGLHERGIHLLEQREHFVADFVPLEKAF